MVKYVDHIEIDSKCYKHRSNLIAYILFFFTTVYSCPQKKQGVLQHPQHPLFPRPCRWGILGIVSQLFCVLSMFMVVIKVFWVLLASYFVF